MYAVPVHAPDNCSESVIFTDNVLFPLHNLFFFGLKYMYTDYVVRHPVVESI